MNKTHMLLSIKKTSVILQAAVIASATLLPAFLLNSNAHGAQLDNRFIDMSATQTSEGSGRDGGDALGQDVSYTVEFDLNTAHSDLEGIVIDFCSNSPITGLACTAPTGFNTNFATLAFADTGANLNANWAIDAGNSTANTLIITDATTTGDTLGSAATITLDLGSAAAADGITNPTSTGTFYARIITYTDDTVAAAYAPTVPGAYLDDGGVALSVANELTVTARVQEVLEFCVGTDTVSTLADATGDDCSTNVGGTALDLDVVDANSVSTTSNIAVPNDGVAMIRTNAASGAVVYYKAELDTTFGELMQAGATCTGTVSDPCFNSVGTTQTAIVSGTEDFGMTLRDWNTSSGGDTTALSCHADYDGDGSCTTGAVTGYAWLDDGSFQQIASSSAPMDDEKVSIEFAATASPTTPTGVYTVTANFVATSTF